MDAFSYFLMFLMTVTSIATLVFVVAQSMVMNKMYEIMKVQVDRQGQEDEAKLRLKGLVDVADQGSYPLRLR